MSRYRRSPILLLAALALAAGAAWGANGNRAERPFEPDVGAGRAVALFAGGCFWCMEDAFEHVDGVVRAVSGYTGGHVDNPTYAQVSAEGTGHAEAVKVVYDPQQVSYDQLLDVFWHNIDPTDAGGQFCDRGDSYRSAIFYVDAAQRDAAEASRRRLRRDPDAPHPIVTEITPATTFYVAEAYHQDYAEKNTLRYKFYRSACRRDAVLKKRWGEAADGHRE